MKKKNTISLLSTIMAAFIFFGRVNAQRDMTGDVVTIAGSSASISNLMIVDSINMGGVRGRDRFPTREIIHLASFEIELGSADAVSVFKTLYSGTQGQQLPDVTINRSNMQTRSGEERIFNAVTVKEISFLELNTESREAPKAKVIIQAQNVSHQESSAGGATTDPTRLSKGVRGNKFKLTIGNLPAQSVSRISKLKITPSTSSEYTYFNLDISSAEERFWSDWLNAGAGGDDKANEATISLQDERNQDILSIQLSAVEISSISPSNSPNLTSGTTRSTGAKTRIGLRTKNMPTVQ
ncbi:MAG TPA: hypothetical protein VFW11_21280 [Cyclobacteriaceae bacterium]|nr:hypothetical protein [Cyclobacteriaceae bacterium]